MAGVANMKSPNAKTGAHFQAAAKVGGSYALHAGFAMRGAYR
jgi:hypothetical protein